MQYLLIEHTFDTDSFMYYDSYIAYTSEATAINDAEERLKDYLDTGEFDIVQYIPTSKNKVFPYSVMIEGNKGKFDGERILIEVRKIYSF